jgi:hypothetical protein
MDERILDWLKNNKGRTFVEKDGGSHLHMSLNLRWGVIHKKVGPLHKIPHGAWRMV